MSPTRRYGIFGGTFNPIHLGHLALAEAAREQCRPDRVYFIPTATPPHKRASDVIDGRHRLAMVRLAIRGHPAFRVSDLELRRGGISYTLRTVQELTRREPSASWFLIVGSDMLAVPWRGLDEIAQRCTFVVGERPSTVARSRFSRIRRIEIPQLAISSSMIRQRIRHRHSIRYLVPEAVATKLVHALESKRPKFRYYVTLPSYAVALLRRMLPAGALDAVARRN